MHDPVEGVPALAVLQILQPGMDRRNKTVHGLDCRAGHEPKHRTCPTVLVPPQGTAGMHHPVADAAFPRRCFGRKIWSMTSAPVVITGRSSRR
jgi:hypothetical protein